ncbi:MAG: gamma-glutamyltranspeptidase [Subtercola sp.]|nr:gamma-glutamyltranspeptidase [Subtercola sp.]
MMEDELTAHTAALIREVPRTEKEFLQHYSGQPHQQLRGLSFQACKHRESSSLLRWNAEPAPLGTGNTQAAYDRPAVLFDGADGQALIHPDRLAARIGGVLPDTVADLSDAYRPGGTTYLCAIDEEGTAVSLIQSNCMSFGSGLVAGDTGIWPHNRGIGFTLAEGHPNELRAHRRTAHTLTPAMIADSSDDVVAVLGTRGGDSQPQVVLQLVARLLAGNEDPASAIAAGRWVLRGEGDETSFRTWEAEARVRVLLEGQSSSAWAPGLVARGHSVQHDEPFAPQYGHAQVIMTDGVRLAGAADPRSDSAAVGGY